MASFGKQETRKKELILNCVALFFNSTSFLKISGPESHLARDHCLARGMRPSGPKVSTPSARDKAVTCFINENHALYLRKCSSADSTKPLSCTG